LKAALLAFDPARDVGKQSLGLVEKISGFAKGSDKDYSSRRAHLDAAGALGVTAPAP
jgi:hypothetical protein